MLDAPRSQPTLPLFDAFPKLASCVSWMSLGHWPTPVQEAKRFASEFGLRQFFIKREDLSHPHGAGNKVRGLEFLLADAQLRGARTIVTASAVGSHHVCKTAWHARQLGIDTVAIVVPQPKAAYVARNLLLGASVGTRYVPANYVTAIPKVIRELLRRNEHKQRPYWIAPGGTTPLSCLGHVNAAFELRRQIDAGQLPIPDYLYVAMGSLGTAAGLAVGCALAGLPTQIVGVVVSHRWYATKGRWLRLARRVHKQMRRADATVPECGIDRARFHIVGSALGRGYALVSEGATRLAERMRAAEGIELDGTYTAKAAHGMMQFIEANKLQDRVHLLWHTFHAIGPRPDLAPHCAQLPPVLKAYIE
ncbi:MAG: pyridoxal-phosphate dependent enzyme [Planctomycetes bacterium]|nr:pyridoxal-phosphate dependent enzyme [Planctomycetota bacterium]